MLTAAECARRTGVTVRALRVYEECGLIAPKRSAGGWRLYGADELLMLNTIALLKTAGLTLAQIGDATRSSSNVPTLQQILQLQLESWTARRTDAERVLAITQAALERLNTGHLLTVEELCNLIRSNEMKQMSPDMSPATERAAEASDSVVLDPAVLDCYTGFYSSHGGEFGLTVVRREGQRLFMLRDGAGGKEIELYPIGEVEFAIRGSIGHVTFVCGDDGQATGYSYRVLDMELSRQRVDAAAAGTIRRHLADRVANNMPVPGSDVALRSLIEGIRAGVLRYEEMAPEFAVIIEKQLPGLKTIATFLGAIKSIDFKGVGTEGWDVYDVQRENGSARWRIAFRSDGKIASAAAAMTSPMPVGMGP